MSIYKARLKKLIKNHKKLIKRKNQIDKAWDNGIFNRYKYPVLTRDHVPLFWKFDLNPKTNPYFMERNGINATFNAGAIYLDGVYYLVVRVEGNDRKSFFAIAHSKSPVDGFVFQDFPIDMPETNDPATNIYDMRLTKHEDGFIYGVFCAERKDESAPQGDLSSAKASAAICRTKDMKTWERLPDLICNSQQRNVVLHPEFVNGKYAFYTRPQDDFIDAGSGGGIGWALVDDITHAEIAKGQELIIDARAYHTIKEVKNGQGAHPIKTEKGWLHIAHGVRGCAAGLRYVIYCFLTDLNEPWKVIAQPGGYLIAPVGAERTGDVSNVVFVNGMVTDEKGNIYIYYASSDTRLHVASTTVEKMLDHVLNGQKDGGNSSNCVKIRNELIEKNLAYIKTAGINIEELR